MRRVLLLALAGLVLVSCGKSNLQPTELTASQEADIPRPDLVGEVLRSDLVHDPVGPVFERGELELVDGTTVTIDDLTDHVRGCDAVRIDSDDGTYVPDLRGCLAIVDLTEAGTARTVSLLDRTDANFDVDGWVLPAHLEDPCLYNI